MAHKTDKNAQNVLILYNICIYIGYFVIHQYGFFGLISGFYRQDARSAYLPVCAFFGKRFFGFSPHRATRCTDQGEIWQGRAALPAKFHLDRFRGVGLRPPKL